MLSYTHDHVAICFCCGLCADLTIFRAVEIMSLDNAADGQQLRVSADPVHPASEARVSSFLQTVSKALQTGLQTVLQTVRVSLQTVQTVRMGL